MGRGGSGGGGEEEEEGEGGEGEEEEEEMAGGAAARPGEHGPGGGYRDRGQDCTPGCGGHGELRVGGPSPDFGGL